MNAAKILYMDGNGVSVTRYALKIGGHTYPLKEITKYNPIVLSPKKLIGILIAILGMLLITTGFLNAEPSVLAAHLAAEHLLHSEMMPFYLGTTMILLGLLAMGRIRKSYALQIVTTEGIKNVVVSQKKEYIIRIIHILNLVIAYDDYIYHPSVQKVNCAMLETPNNISLN